MGGLRAALEIFQKVGGQWKLAAIFARPLNRGFQTAFDYSGVNWPIVQQAPKFANEEAFNTRQNADDRILWTGPMKHPVIGSEKPEYFPGADVGKRKNSKNISRVVRLEVASSGHLAWRFSYGKSEYDLDGPPVTHRLFYNAMLHVFKKADIKWKSVATFARPIDAPLEPEQ